LHRKLAEKSSCRTDLAALGALRAAAPAPVAGVAAALPPAAPHSKQLHGSSERFRQHAETFATEQSIGGRRANFCGISRLILLRTRARAHHAMPSNTAQCRRPRPGLDLKDNKLRTWPDKGWGWVPQCLSVRQGKLGPHIAVEDQGIRPKKQNFGDNKHVVQGRGRTADRDAYLAAAAAALL